MNIHKNFPQFVSPMVCNNGDSDMSVKESWKLAETAIRDLYFRHRTACGHLGIA